MKTENELLNMALAGYIIKRANIDSAIARLESKIGHVKGPGTRRNLSAAARARISAAQRKRWREFHRELAKGAR